VFLTVVLSTPAREATLLIGILETIFGSNAKIVAQFGMIIEVLAIALTNSLFIPTVVSMITDMLFF